MCVVLICPPKQRPDLTILRACHAANPHGAGVAWRDKRRIHWRKALTPGEVNHLIQQVHGEVIIHFRWASVGGVEPLLCHPFPVTAEAALGYEGLCKSVLFHNGTWGNWESAQEIIGDLDGPMSDSRAVAALVHHKGSKPLKKLPGRWAIMHAKEIELFGDWQPWRGFLVSNTSFLPYLTASAGRASFSTQTPHSAEPRRKPSPTGNMGQLPLALGNHQS
jgi:hypothetical protein